MHNLSWSTKLPQKMLCLEVRTSFFVYLNSFLKGVDWNYTKNRSEDFSLVSGHAGVHVCEDGGAHEIALGVLVHCDIASVQLKLKNVNFKPGAKQPGPKLDKY